MAMVRNKGKVSIEDQAVYYMARETLSSSSYLILNKPVLKKYGLVNGVILSNLIEKDKYWERKNPETYDGWFYLTSSHQMDSLGVSRGSIQKAKALFVEEKILKIKRKGMPSKEWYLLDYPRLINSIFSQPTDSQPTVKVVGKPTVILEGYNNNISSKNKKGDILGDHVQQGYEKSIILAQRLSQIIQSKKKINHSPSQVGKWAKDIQYILSTTLGDLSPEKAYKRVEKALHWYRSHFGLQFIPVIESGSSLREKFLRLEAAMEREGSCPVTADKKAGKGKFAQAKKIKWEDLEE